MDKWNFGFSTKDGKIVDKGVKVCCKMQLTGCHSSEAAEER